MLYLIAEPGSTIRDFHKNVATLWDPIPGAEKSCRLSQQFNPSILHNLDLATGDVGGSGIAPGNEMGCFEMEIEICPALPTLDENQPGLILDAGKQFVGNAARFLAGCLEARGDGSADSFQ